MPRCHRVGSLPLASGQTPPSRIEAVITISRDAPWDSFTSMLLWFLETAQNHMARWTHCGEVDSDAEEDDHSLGKWGHYRLNCFETLTKQRLRSSCSSSRSALPTISLHPSISPTFNSPEDYAAATFFPRSDEPFAIATERVHRRPTTNRPTRCPSRTRSLFRQKLRAAIGVTNG
jgi:hypothetical protein